MNRILLTLLTISLAAASPAAQTTAHPTDKINPAGRIILDDFKIERENYFKNSSGDLMKPQGKTPFEEPQISAVIILKEGCTSDVLDTLNLKIVSEINGVVVVKCPVTETERIASLPEVLSVGFGDLLRPTLDFARPSGKVNEVQDGFSYDGSTMSFDGTGVVCGMMDTGLEANHINFKNDDGTSRIKRLWYMNSNDGSSREYTDLTISQFATDNTSEGHATHVAGIIGGGYKGNGKYKKMSAAASGSGTMMTDSPIPYYGVSTGADLAFSVGELYTPNIIQGVTNIIDYAESVGKPVVVNLSLGHTTGPHDGSDYYTQALARLGERGIICMSAGNDGDEQISVTKTLTSTGNGAYLRTIPVSKYSNGSIAYGRISGVADLWTNGSTPVTVSLKAFSGEVASAIEVMSVTAANQTVRSSSSSNFSTYFTGSVTMQSTVDPNNNRFNVYIEFNDVALASTNTTRYLMIEVSGSSGTKLYLYGNSLIFNNKTTEDGATPVALSKGSAAESINDGCCGENVISVGAYTSRTYWGRLSGDVYMYTGTGYKVGSIAPFSSYGTNYQGTKLPLICAPGANIISSYSSYYAGSNASTTMCGSATSGSKTYYWGTMQGTSMSCPFVTGTIGLWLQADPTLDFDKVMEVINKTSTYNALSMRSDAARWGAGMIDAQKGMQFVLEHKAGIGEVWADPDQRFILTATADGYEAFIAGATGVRVNVYDLQGRRVTDAAANSDRVDVTTAPLTPGVYILEATAADGQRFTRKITR